MHWLAVMSPLTLPATMIDAALIDRAPGRVGAELSSRILVLAHRIGASTLPCSTAAP
jgi:hypothetical protein